MKTLFKPHPQPTLTKRDIKRLEGHVLSARKLNEVLVMDSVSLNDLQRMALIEASKPKPRQVILKKLIGRIYSRARNETLEILFVK